MKEVENVFADIIRMKFNTIAAQEYLMNNPHIFEPAGGAYGYYLKRGYYIKDTEIYFCLIRRAWFLDKRRIKLEEILELCTDDDLRNVILFNINDLQKL